MEADMTKAKKKRSAKFQVEFAVYCFRCGGKCVFDPANSTETRKVRVTRRARGVFVSAGCQKHPISTWRAALRGGRLGDKARELRKTIAQEIGAPELRKHAAGWLKKLDAAARQLA
jgi:hypothetical protein